MVGMRTPTVYTDARFGRPLSPCTMTAVDVACGASACRSTDAESVVHPQIRLRTVRVDTAVITAIELAVFRPLRRVSDTARQ
eukprot:1858229-Prymnesium_polylepis.2